MRLIRPIALLIACAAGLLSPSVQARDWDSIRMSGVLRLATEGAYPPFNFYEGAQLKGYEVDVAEAVARKLTVKVEWKALGFDALIPAVRQDRIDAAIASHGYTPERAKAVDFTSPHYCSGGQIVSRAGGPKTVAELQGKIVVVQLATSYAEAAGKLSGVKEVKTLPKDTDALAALVAGRADAWITDRFVAKTSLDKAATGSLQRGEMVFTEKVSFILKKDNAKLQAALSKAVDDLRADGSLATLSNRWFKEDIANCR